MLHAAGCIATHRFLFADLRQHVLGWPHSLIPDGRRVNFRLLNRLLTQVERILEINSRLP